MNDEPDDEAMDPEREMTPLDGGGLVRAFERARSRASSEADGETVRERTERVLEASAYVAALEAIGRLSSVARADREALAGRVRRTLLSLAGMAIDDDDRDALDVAARYAREGLRALSGTPSGSPPAERIPGDRGEPGGDDPPPPVRDLVRLIRGELDGFASADVALRLRGSARGRAELARLVPSILSRASARFRVAAESLSPDAPEPAAPLLDPTRGRAIGSLSVGPSASAEGALEAFAFPDGIVALYADPPLPLRVTGDGVEQRGSRPGYAEVRVREGVVSLTARVEYGDRSFEWVLSLA